MLSGVVRGVALHSHSPHDLLQSGDGSMHRKSLEAAQHLKESGSEREGSEAEGERPLSASPHRPDRADRPDLQDHQAQSSPGGSSTTASSSAKGRASPEPGREPYEDHEAFRNNSIACLRAKAQEHQARLLSNNLLLQHEVVLLSTTASPCPLVGYHQTHRSIFQFKVLEQHSRQLHEDWRLQVRGLQRAGAAAMANAGAGAMGGAMGGALGGACAGAGSEDEGPLDIDVGTEPPPPARLY
ncbi:hypothetical protein RR48_08804 [Papilio machaon]|uniref:OAR domain-containing protein n=1 Tax=Papilio machaon TaxID=76193 RepID=A0A194RHK9_PAPMA|nr:hypothetical protein RR48_08804 [Papilio machaon]